MIIVDRPLRCISEDMDGGLQSSDEASCHGSPMGSGGPNLITDMTYITKITKYS